MKRCLALWLLLGCTVQAVASPARAAGERARPVTFERLKTLPADCPIVYDNDWLQDTPDIHYLLHRASRGEARLRGLVLTKDQWDNDRLYKVEQGVADFRKTLDVARRSGLSDLPQIEVGAPKRLTRPASGTIEDTDPELSDGARRIIAEARLASAEKPLVVLVGGPISTVASAYLAAPEIGDRMIVLMTDLQGYNGADHWANYVVATRCQLANYGANPVWWPQRPQPPVMPLERFRDLPVNPLTADVERIATMFWQRSTRSEKPDRDDGFADGAGMFLLFQPQSWRAVRKMKATGVFSTQPVEGEDYDYLDATDLDYQAMSDEFFSELKK